ncbi:unnamed protein product [Didymodactylos carnosus]|uniref:Uncharacterized protein n=1 Tax=Didymodactylos carnosus TaxID=1234261 RepID=A0A815RD81_9BILA|nr:unnamed protein product [Didymodactylos carnosus]CAF1560777.1 unnamed protein product [Didymodactylos carnosus]CAF4341803.1 unnamed protein product [Didymodactylos carnosus]CAF4352568.1 unnamed protein product [Didymodactylos carnosus]
MNSCVQTFGNRTYDLNLLSRFVLNGTDTTRGNRFWFAPCNSLPKAVCGYEVSGAMSCELDNRNEFDEFVSYMDGYRTPNATYRENPDGPGTGVIMITQN